MCDVQVSTCDQGQEWFPPDDLESTIEEHSTSISQIQTQIYDLNAKFNSQCQQIHQEIDVMRSQIKECLSSTQEQIDDLKETMAFQYEELKYLLLSQNKVQCPSPNPTILLSSSEVSTDESRSASPVHFPNAPSVPCFVQHTPAPVYSNASPLVMSSSLSPVSSPIPAPLPSTVYQPSGPPNFVPIIPLLSHQQVLPQCSKWFLPKLFPLPCPNIWPLIPKMLKLKFQISFC